MSVSTIRLVTIPPSPLQGLLRFDHYFSAAVHPLIVLRRVLPYESAAFPRSGNSICASIPLGLRYEPAGWDVPVTQHGRS